MPADLPKTHLMLGAAKQQLSSRFDAGQGGLPV
jgi:hypothetical protein